MLGLQNVETNKKKAQLNCFEKKEIALCFRAKIQMHVSLITTFWRQSSSCLGQHLSGRGRILHSATG